MLVNHHSTTLETLWNRAQAGEITWAEVQQYQTDRMPRCANHPDRPAPIIWGDTAVCADCVAAIVEERKER